MTTESLGNKGEGIACEYLVSKGYNIMERNYRISFGEIDIIAKKLWSILHPFQKPTIHFIEVKTIVAHDGFFPEDRVDYKKQRKLRQLSQIWLQKHGYFQDHPRQIDVIGIIINKNTGEAGVHCFENVVSDEYA